MVQTDPHAAVKRGMTFTHNQQVWRILGIHKKVGNKWKPTLIGKKGSASYKVSGILMRKNVVTKLMGIVEPEDLLTSSRVLSKKDARKLYIGLAAT